MDISISTDVYSVYMWPRIFCQIGLQQHNSVYSPFPRKKPDADISLLKLLKKISKSKKKHTFALKCTILVEYVKFRENPHNFIDAVLADVRSNLGYDIHVVFLSSVCP